MQLTPYLVFDGQCREAFTFYAETFGGEIITMQSFGDSPGAEHAPAEMQGQIMHAFLRVNGAMLMGSDAPPGQFQRAQGLSVALQVDDPAEAERIFAALADGGQVTMPIQKTFWAERFGMVTDRFGTPWMVNGGQAA